MGRFSVKLQLANHRDVIKAEEGTLAPELVRRAEVEGVVDSGATRLMLPTAVADQLGLPRVGKATVRYADRRSEDREVVGEVDLTLLGRTSVFTAVLEPNRTDALVGAIVMEELDFLIDCGAGVLRPRDPRAILNEAE